jgi:hypothetical protein
LMVSNPCAKFFYYADYQQLIITGKIFLFFLQPKVIFFHQSRNLIEINHQHIQ